MALDDFMEFDEDKVEYDLYKAMKRPIKDHSLCHVDLIEPVAQDVFHIPKGDTLQPFIENDIDKSHTDFSLSANMEGIVAQMDEKGKVPIHRSFGNWPQSIDIKQRACSFCFAET